MQHQQAGGVRHGMRQLEVLFGCDYHLQHAGQVTHPSQQWCPAASGSALLHRMTCSIQDHQDLGSCVNGPNGARCSCDTTQALHTAVAQHRWSLSMTEEAIAAQDGAKQLQEAYHSIQTTTCGRNPVLSLIATGKLQGQVIVVAVQGKLI